MDGEIDKETMAKALRKYAEELRENRGHRVTDRVTVMEMLTYANQLSASSLSIAEGTPCRANLLVSGEEYIGFYRSGRLYQGETSSSLVSELVTNIRPIQELKPTQVAIDIPPLSEWPSKSEKLEISLGWWPYFKGHPASWTEREVSKEEARRVWEESESE